MRDEIRDINRRVNDVNNPINLNRLINLVDVDGVHIPNLIIADKICFQCIDVWDLYVSRNINCQNECGIQHFNNNNDFCYWLLKQKNYIGSLTI